MPMSINLIRAETETHATTFYRANLILVAEWKEIFACSWHYNALHLVKKFKFSSQCHLNGPCVGFFAAKHVCRYEEENSKI